MSTQTHWWVTLFLANKHETTNLCWWTMKRMLEMEPVFKIILWISDSIERNHPLQLKYTKNSTEKKQHFIVLYISAAYIQHWMLKSKRKCYEFVCNTKNWRSQMNESMGERKYLKCFMCNLCYSKRVRRNNIHIPQFRTMVANLIHFTVIVHGQCVLFVCMALGCFPFNFISISITVPIQCECHWLAMWDILSYDCTTIHHITIIISYKTMTWQIIVMRFPML